LRGILRRPEQLEEDLIDIWRYIAENDYAAADRMLDRLEAAMATLGQNPQMGPARPDLAEGLRYFPVGRYVLLYREIAGGVEIVRCAHGARDLFGLALPED
jgi:toxin ParE1/3/4